MIVAEQNLDPIVTAREARKSIRRLLAALRRELEASIPTVRQMARQKLHRRGRSRVRAVPFMVALVASRAEPDHQGIPRPLRLRRQAEE
jgi:hypothetical protein